MIEYAMRYRSTGLVDLGIGLGIPTPHVLRDGDRLDLLIGSDVWPMKGFADGLPYYEEPLPARVPENLGWSFRRLDAPRSAAALP